MDIIHTTLGLVGVLLLALSGIPQVYRLLRTKTVSGLSPYSTACVLFGCVFMCIFEAQKDGLSVYQSSYICNSLISFINLVLYIRYRNK